MRPRRRARFVSPSGFTRKHMPCRRSCATLPSRKTGSLLPSGPAMKCPKCQHENTVTAKFCEECAAPLTRTCDNCRSQVSLTAKFCPQCGHPLRPVADDPRFASPRNYTPQHLADKILTSRAALEGERKQVTVLFADIKGSMELLADRDPEDAQKLLDPVLERMIEAVHRYEGIIVRVLAARVRPGTP